MTDSCTRTVPFGTPVQQGALWDRLQERSRFPLSVVWSLTSRCNLACPHCSVPRGPEKDELGHGAVLRLLDEMASLGVLMLSFTGGEPTLREDLPAIVRAARARRFSVRLKTNAVQLESPLVGALSDAGLASVSSSLYSMRAAEHDAFVGRAGAWKSALSAWRRLKKRDVNVSIGFILMGWNATSVPDFLDLCESEGFDYLVDPQITPREDGDLAPQALRADCRQIEAVFADPRLTDRFRLNRAAPRSGSWALCAAGRSAAYIHHDGELRPCANLVLRLGDLKERRFRDIWLRSDTRRAIAAMRWADLPECAACPRSGICARCMGTALLETGDIRARSDTACAVAEAISALCVR